MRIVFVITGLGAGGAEQMMCRLVKGMSPRFEPIVISLTDGGAQTEGLDRAGIPVYTMGMTGVGSFGHAVHRLVRMYRSLRPDVVSTWMYHADLVGGLAARFAGISALAWNIRNSDLSPEHSSWLTRKLVRLNATLSRRIPRAILCCSETARRIHVSLGYDPDRFIVIPNGFDLRDFVPDIDAAVSVRRELSIPLTAPVVGLIARWDPQKNHRGFIAAAAELRRRIPQAHFLLAGENVDPDNPELKAWVERAGIGSAVRLLGFRKDIPRLTAALDVATSSSTYGEAFPNVLGEAMACGVPCVATDVGDSAFIVGDTGRIVAPAEVGGLVDAWEWVLTLPQHERLAMGEKARKRVAGNFDLIVVRERYEEVFQQLAAEP